MEMSLYRVAPLDGPAVGIPDGSGAITAAWFAALLRRHQDSRDAVEHVRVNAAGHGFGVAVFTNEHGQARSDTAARRLIHRALASEPDLRLWRIV
jgi:hypothetical protein